nr:hypothetical protein HK105_003226 [Polyrhizophydium stewartii]
MSLNPSWDLAGGNLHFPPHALQQSRFVLSMFAAHAHAHSHAHAHAHPAAPDGPSAACDETHLIWSRAIDLSDMLYLGPDLADLDMHFAPNTLLFELDDGFYAPATADRSAGSRPARDPTDADVVPVKVPKDRVLPSYRYPHLVRIMSVCASVSAVEEETEAILARSTTRLAALEAAESRAAEAQAVRARIRAAEKAAMELTQETQMLQVRLHEMRAAVRQRRQRLAKLAAGKRDERQSLMRARDGLALTRKEMSRTLLHITQRRQQHIADLQTIFPIAAHEDGCPTIRGIKLPNTNFAGQDDERIATALGFTAHLVTLLAYYLDVPLRYYMLPISSRSTVWDVVSLQFQGSKEFPLFARGSERIRFEYAVFLINKNIEQLLNHTGRPVKNLRNTLPNVRALCAVVAAWATGGDADGAVDWSGPRSPSPAPRPPRGVRHVASAPRLSLVSRLLWGAAGAADPLRPTIGAGADPEADGDADDDVL